jgi:hypothetical protein
MKKAKTLAAALAMALGLSSGVATADFSGAYDVSKWTASGGGIDTSRVPSSITMQDAAGYGDTDDQSSLFSIAVVEESYYSFIFDAVWPDLNLEENHADKFAFLVNGAPLHGVGYLDLYLKDGFVSIFVDHEHVQAGDIIGFQLCCHDPNATLFSVTIHDLYISAIPEPETYAIFLAGLGLLGWRMRNARS